jgi:hypothetical protein
MTPDRRKILRGILAAMAASGMILGERRSALAARKMCDHLLDRLNGDQKFTADQIRSTARHFKDHFKDHPYKFGHWILEDDDWFGHPLQSSPFTKEQWQDIVDNKLEPELSKLLTDFIEDLLNENLNSADPIPLEFECPDELSKYHRVTIEPSTSGPGFSGYKGYKITVQCNET